MDVVTKLTEFSNRRHAISIDPNLSDQGRQTAMQKVNSEAENFRGEALRQLRISWDGWKSEARRNIETLQDATDKSAAAWDYARLNYQAQAISKRIATAGSFADVTRAYQQAKESGDRHAWRAWTETAGAAVGARFSQDPEAKVFIKDLATDAPEAIDTPEVKAAKAEGIKLTQRGRELNEQTQRARAFYHPNGASVFGLPDDFSKLTEGVRITSRVNAETLATVTEIQLT